MPRADGEGRRVALRRRRAGSGQEPPRARVRRRGRGRTGRSCSTGPATRSCGRRTGRSSRRSTSSCAATEPDELRAALGAGGGELTRLLPDLPARLGELPAPVEADPDTERHRLHTAVTDLLAERQSRQAAAARARGRPLGGRSDAAPPAPSRALGRTTPACCCSRPSATPRRTCRQSLSETLADLRRSDDVVRLRLAGLSGDEVAEFVAPRRRRRSRRRRCASSRRRSTTSPRATRSSSASSGAPWSRPGPSRSPTGRSA